MSDQTEVRITNPVTGGAKGQKAERFDLIPAGPMEAVARHYGIGARKYDDDNWRKGYSWRLTLGALERHLNKIKKGEDIDVDTLPDGTVVESPHAAAIVFHALALLEFAETHPELDDRWKPEPPAPAAPTLIDVFRSLSLSADWLDPAPITPLLRSQAAHPSYGTHVHSDFFDAAPPLVAADPEPRPEPYAPKVGNVIASRDGFEALPKGTQISHLSGNRATKVGSDSWQASTTPRRRWRSRHFSLNGWAIESLPQPTPKYAGGDRISVRDVARALEAFATVVGPDSDGEQTRICDPNGREEPHLDAVEILNALEEEGYEVTYAGGRVTPEPEVKVVPQDGVDFGTVLGALEGVNVPWDGTDDYVLNKGDDVLLYEDDVQIIVDALDRAGLRVVEKA